MSEKKYVLIVEWFDPTASLIKQFYLTYFLPANHIEMYDIKNQKIFLKKISYPEVKLTDLYIGNVIIVFNRQLKIVDYGDAFTKQSLAGANQANKTYGMLKPNAYLNFGKIITAAENQFTISNLKMFQFDVPAASYFYAEHQGKSMFQGLVNFMVSDFSVGLELIANDAIIKWRKLIGPTNYEDAKQKAPQSLRALYAQSSQKNACHGSDSIQSAERQCSFVFGPNTPLKANPLLTNCTLCIIKPHIVKSKQIGAVVNEILAAGFQISAMQMIWFDVQVSTEFYEVYKFLPECKRMIDHLASGPSVALEIRQENALEKFREFCGPYDPEIARQLQKSTLRAKFGLDRVQNAVHCTDLTEDGPLEVQFVFRTLLG